MKRLFLTAVSMVLATHSVFGAGDPMVSRFELKRPLDGTFTAGEQARVVVPDDLFGEALDFPNDVRIIGSDGVQWPCFLHVPEKSDGYSAVEISILNKSYVGGSRPCLQFDLDVPAVHGRPQVHNQLELHTSGSDFVRRVEIGTGQGADAGLLATGYLIDFSRQKDARNRTVRYPDSDVSRLHVRIYTNAQSTAEVFDLLSARLRQYAEQESERERIAAEELELPAREQEETAQSFLFDLGAANRPAEYVVFEVAKGSYARCVSVYGRNTDHERWSRVGGGGIHAFDDDEDHEVRIRAHHRFLKVNVFHYDDRPLDISGIFFEAVPRYLVFEASGAGSAALYFKGWDMKAPRYDLRGRIDKTAVDELPVISTFDTEANVTANVQHWRKYSKLLAGLAVGVVSLGVIAIIVSMLRQQQMMGEQ